jgi:hypothetical protein
MLRVEDFPDYMRDDFRKLKEELPKSEQPYFRNTRRQKIAELLLSLYTKATRLDGMVQERFDYRPRSSKGEGVNTGASAR